MTTTIKIYSYKNFSIVKSTGETFSTEIRAKITKFNNIIINYDSVIDPLKFVLFIKLVKPDYELWILSHRKNEKIRQRAMIFKYFLIPISLFERTDSAI